MESTGIPAEGEYKDYFFEVDENYIVTIIGKLKGEKPTINAEIITQGIVAQGGKVEIKVTAGISEGTITNIEATNGAVLKEDAQTSDGEKIYEVTENGIYYFKATADNGRSAVVEVKVDLIEIGSNMTVQVGSDITVQAPAGWIVVSSYLNDLPLSKYSKVKITFSFTAGYDWAFYFVTDDGDEYAFDGSHIYGHVSVPTTTKIYDIPKDKNYTKIRFASSSLNAIVQVDEVYLIK